MWCNSCVRTLGIITRRSQCAPSGGVENICFSIISRGNLPRPRLSKAVWRRRRRAGQTKHHGFVPRLGYIAVEPSSSSSCSSSRHGAAVVRVRFAFVDPRSSRRRFRSRTVRRLPSSVARNLLMISTLTRCARSHFFAFLCVSPPLSPNKNNEIW